MNGFGFLEYEDAMDARDVVPGNDTINPEESPTNSVLFSVPYAFQIPFCSL
jgi:hypothetical protein